MFNNTQDDINASVVAALYDSNGKLVKLVFETKDIQGKEEESANLKIPMDQAGHCVKLFIWDGISNMKPLARTVIFPE